MRNSEENSDRKRKSLLTLFLADALTVRETESDHPNRTSMNTSDALVTGSHFTPESGNSHISSVVSAF